MPDDWGDIGVTIPIIFDLDEGGGVQLLGLSNGDRGRRFADRRWWWFLATS
jgi:hypothetical protein